MKRPFFPFLLLMLAALLSANAVAADIDRKWDNLLDITCRFSWYPQADLQKLLDLKSEEYGQSLLDYRRELVRNLTTAPSGLRLRTEDLLPGHPWRDYLHLSLAEFCLFLATEQQEHLENARHTLAILARKTDQPEVHFWSIVYRAHQAALTRDRSAFIEAVNDLWHNVILPYETTALAFSAAAVPAGFGSNLPYFYENLAYLVLRKGILDQEIPELYPLTPLILDIQPKLTVKNGYQLMVDQVVERMRGPQSDNLNLNFAVAMLEASARRYAFEDEKDPAQLVTRYNQVRKYQLLTYCWADTDKGRAVVLLQNLGFLDYLVRRLSDPADPLASQTFFQAGPAVADDHLDRMNRYLSGQAQTAEGNAEPHLASGFSDRTAYLETMHTLFDAFGKLCITQAEYYRSQTDRKTGEITLAARPLERYCRLFARYARTNSDLLPDCAYFLAACAARQLGELYREQARFALDSRADRLAFTYQLQAIELFPLDLPGILQMAQQSAHGGQVEDYLRQTRNLAARLRVSPCATTWAATHSDQFTPLVELMPTMVPAVINHAYALLENVPAEATEDRLFAYAVATELPQSRRSLAPAPAAQQVALTTLPQTRAEDANFPFYALKNRLFADPDHPIHHYLRTLFNEVPYPDHAYVALLETAP